MIRKPLIVPELMRRIDSPNRAEIARRIATAPDAPIDLPPELRFVFTCFTNRCGSAYLGDILASTGWFTQAGEDFNAGNVLAYCQQHDVRSFRQYFEQVARQEARNSTYGVKLGPEQLVLLTETGILDQIVERSDFLFMNRVDKLAQAISRTIAQQNNRWAWDSPVDFPDAMLAYSSERITHHLCDITLLNLSFEQFFGLNGIVPVTVEYERLVAAPQRELDEIARRLRLSGLRMDSRSLRYRRQANQINQAWRSRFLAETTARPTVAYPNATARQEGTTAPVPAVTADIVAHVHNVGDVTGECGTWIGKPGSKMWIEGFSITPRQGIAAEDIEYRGVGDFAQTPPWISGGTFCGTRGVGEPLRGISVRLRNAAASQFECSYSARFVDGTTAETRTAGQLCYSTGMVPIETFFLQINPRSRPA
jgi:LPS sulfotransferase NodH